MLGMEVRMSVASQPDAPNRDLLVEQIVASTGIDEAMIDRLVRSFYAKARQDSLIGPVFESKVHNWEAHFTRMCAFWSSVALMSGRYHGQPMAVHMPLPIDTPHFDRWLEIFAATAEGLPAGSSQLFPRARLSHRRQPRIGHRIPEEGDPAETRTTTANLSAGPDHDVRRLSIAMLKEFGQS
jgi:hemoglobin